MPTVTGNKSRLRLTRKMPYADLERVRQQPIVGIEEGEISTAAGTHTGIARRRRTLISLPDQAHARKATRYLGSRIFGAVVNHDDFKPRIRLRLHALNRLR